MQLTEADHHLARVMLEQRLVDQNGLRHLAYQAQQEGLSFQQIVQRSGLWPQQQNTTPTNDHTGTQVDPPAPAPAKNVVFGTHFGASSSPIQAVPVSQPPPVQASGVGSGAYTLATVQELPSEQLLAASSKQDITAVQAQQSASSSISADNVLTINQSQPDSHGVANSLSDTQGSIPSQVKELKNLGPYEVVGELGRGAMGVVYKARHTGLDRICALKVLISGEDASVNSLNRFVAEAKTAARLDDHPHIVKVLDSGHVDRMYFMAMELVEGLSLQKLIDADKVKPKAGARVVADIADALDYAHERGVIHRDIKPDNILIDLNSTPMLNDFGVAKAAEESGQTMTGVVMGTLAFMAPEQAEDSKNVDARSDIYGLGAVLYTIITKRPPHIGTTAANVMASLMTREPPLPSSLNKDLDPDLEKIVMKSLERDPSKRFQSAGQLRDALNAYRKGESGLLERLVPSPAKKKPNKLIPLIAGVGLVLVLSVMGFLLFGPKDKSEQISDTGTLAKNTKPADSTQTSPGPKTPPEPKPQADVDQAADVAPKRPAAGPLTLALTSPTNLAVSTTKNTLMVEGKVEPATATITISGKSIPVKNGRFSSPVGLPEGRSSIEVIAAVDGQTDKSMTIKVTCDSVRPVVSLIRPKPGIINYSNVRVGVLMMSFSEPIEDIEINGKSPKFFRVKKRRRALPTEFRQKLALPEGQHRFEIVAIDRAGNKSLPVKTTLCIDLTAPKILVDNASFKSIDGAFEVMVRIEDATKVKLSLGGKELTATDTNTYKVQFSPNDRNSTQLKAIDEAGNVSTKTLAPPLVLLRDHTKWSAASKEAQDLEIALVEQFLGEAFKRGDTKLYICNKSKYRIAQFSHVKTGMIFHLLPGGNYSMGSSDANAEAIRKLAQALPGGGRNADSIVATEQPQHQVKVLPFLIGRYEVSIAQWKKLPDVGGKPKRGSSSRPMHDLSWSQANSWCRKMGDGFRLPSESEWEYACRANTKTLYYWSDRFDKSYVWHRKPAKPKKRKRPKRPRPPKKGPFGKGPPGGFPDGPDDFEGPPDLSDFKIKLQSVTSHSNKDNGFGLVNMLGNVWEWCEDSYHTNYRGGPYNHEPRRGIQKYVKRGGSVANLPLICRPGFRDMNAPLPIPGPVGFRVAISLP